MNESILLTIKKLLGIDASYAPFNMDVIIQINTALRAVNQLGIGTANFEITGDQEIWADFLGDNQAVFSLVKTYIYGKVRLVFDPPTSSSVMQALKEATDECEWRLIELADGSGSGGGSGGSGTDGFSPIVAITQITGGHRITITDVEGDHVFDVMDGSKGAKGDKGDTGATGPQGPKGDKGDAGETGATGPQGPKGDKGDPGADGKDGKDGEDGYTPIKGVDYFDGAQGPKGDKGDKGDTGATGPQGPKGEDGADGKDGEDGYTPVKGVDYFDGAKGDKGDKGDTGATGATGPQGPKGDKGDKGDDGDAGDPGVYIGSTAPSDPDATVWIDTSGEGDIVTVTGANPVINGVSNTMYICGEVSTITINPPADGSIIDVIFTSGSTVAVLTLPQTVQMPYWFEVEANKTYEINIFQNLGAVMSWT